MFSLLEMDMECSVNASYLSGETEVKFGLDTQDCTSYRVKINSKNHTRYSITIVQFQLHVHDYVVCIKSE